METGANGAGSVVLALPGDLMFASRIRGAAGMTGTAVVVCPRPAVLYAELGRVTPDLVLIDLDARSWDPIAVIAALVSDHAVPQDRIIGFVSHVRADVISAARAAGAGRVLARSAFIRDLPDLLRGGGD